MIKLTDLFEDITVSPKRVLIFKIPATLSMDDDYDAKSEIEYFDGVSISSQALLPDLNLYAKYPVMEFSEVTVKAREGIDKFDDVRCIFCAPKAPTYLGQDLPDGCSYTVRDYDQTGFCYVSFKGVGNIKLDDVKELVNISLYSDEAFETVQDAANYLLFKSN
jgi:hypothetical protein